MPATVRAAFDAYPADVRAHLLTLRRAIFETADALGLPVEESLKWGQPSYAAPKGSPIRLGAPKGGGYALYAHCATRLIEEHRLVAPDLDYEGNRAVRLSGPPPLDALRPLIASALTYHR